MLNAEATSERVINAGFGKTSCSLILQRLV